MCHITRQGEEKEEVTFQFPHSRLSFLSIVLRSYPHLLSSGCVAQPFTERDKSHLELQPWGQTRRQPTPQTHTHMHTYTVAHTLIPTCPKMLLCGGTRGVCHSYLTHSFSQDFPNARCSLQLFQYFREQLSLGWL